MEAINCRMHSREECNVSKPYITVRYGLRLTVMQYAKTPEGKWLLTEYESESTVLALQSIQFEITFNDLYERVNFADDKE